MPVYDVVVVGSGGAGLTAAIEASTRKSKVLVVTKSGAGYSNTLYAQGGISAAVSYEDSPETHYRDTRRCGNYRNIPALAKALVSDGIETIAWLERIGVSFDRNKSGDYELKRSSGASVPRVLSCGDRTGAVIIKGLMKAFRASGCELLDDSRVDCIANKDKKFVIKVSGKKEDKLEGKSIVLAAGGSCYSVAKRREVPTSNCHDSTGEISTIGVKLGAKMINRYSYQYHPLGYAGDNEMKGRPIPESLLWLGGRLRGRGVNIAIEEFKDRGQLSSYMIRGSIEGKSYCSGSGPFFKLSFRTSRDMAGKSFLKRRFSILKEIEKFHPDIFGKGYIPVFPTMHYQNGGILIDEYGWTGIEGLYAAGEITGGIHGTGRMMGNSLLDIICFGRRAGKNVARRK